MATGGEEQVGFSLVYVGAVTLGNANIPPTYSSIVICQNKIIVLEFKDNKVKIHRLHDGKFLDMLDSDSRPLDICLMDATTICVLHHDGLIEMVSIKSEDMSPVFTRMKSFRLDGVFDYYECVVIVNDNIVVVGVKQDTTYWCIASLDDGHVDTIHRICKKSRCCSVTTKDNIIYISCDAGDNYNNYDYNDNDTGVYAFDILNPSQCKYKYKHERQLWPRSIVINEDGNIFVCNGGLVTGDDGIRGYESGRFYGTCIHQLTASCQLVAIFTEGIPRDLQAMFWDNRRLYVTRRVSRGITVFHHVYQGSHKASEVLASHERKQPGIDESALQIAQGNVDNGQSNVETEMPPSRPSSEDSEDEKQDPIIPSEVLNMDPRSIEMFKKALRDGKEKVFNVRIMVVGPYDVGKTTLTKRLLGKDVNICERQSTEGIDIQKECCKVSLTTGEWITQEQNAEEYLRLQRLVKFLNEQVQQKSNDKEQEPKEMEAHVSSAKQDIGHDQHDLSVRVKQDIDQGVMPTLSQPVESPTAILSPEASSEVGSRENEKKDAVMEILQLVNKNSDKLENSIVEYAKLGMWDFAGQYVFYTTHQTFLSYRAVYILVIDLSQPITALTKDACFLDTAGIKPCEVLDMIHTWMNSIHSCTPSPQSGIPAVILVGTHGDMIPEKSQKEVFEEVIRSLKDKPTHIHLKGYIAIDNTLQDPRLQELKRIIFEQASKQPHWGEEKPVRWIPMEQAIMKIRSSGIKVVRISVLDEINRSGSVRIEGKDEMDLFLRFQHEIGSILYFSAEGLRDTIVLDPQWTIDALKSLITAEMFISDKPGIPSKWFEFRDNGKLTHDLIDAIWTKEKYPDFHDNKNYLLLLMEKLNLIARPKSYGEDGKEVKEEDYYLAPCMLREAVPKKIISPESDPEIGNTSVLCFVCTAKFLPPPVFHRLLGACLTHWPIVKQSSRNLIYCGCGVFDLDKVHKLTIYFRDYVIFTRVKGVGAINMHQSSEVCSKVKSFIYENLKRIVGTLGQSLQFELHVQCPKTDPESFEGLIAVSVLQKSAKVLCDSHENSHMLESQNLLKFWFEDKEEDYYLAPCMLQQAKPKGVICPKSDPENESTSVLCYVCKGKFLPTPIFHRLVGACRTRWPIAKKRSENQIYCGCCVFHLDHHHRLTLHFFGHVIYARATGRGVTDTSQSLKLYIEARKFIFENLLKITGNLGQTVQFEMHIQCPNCDADSTEGLFAVSLLQKHEKVVCDSHDESHTLVSQKLLRLWFEDGVPNVMEGIGGGKKSKVSEKGEDASVDGVSSTSIQNGNTDIQGQILPQAHDVRAKTKSFPSKHYQSKGVPCSDPKLLCQILQKSQQAASSSQSTLEANCLSVGLELHGETPADGNCFFEAVSSQLRRLNCVVQKSPQQLRQEVVAFMRTNRVIQASEGTIHLESFICNELFDVYCSRMARDSEWADHVVVVAMARMLQMDIMIVTSSPSSGPENIIVWVVGKTAFQKDPILLGHVWESHYMSLQPIAPLVIDQELPGQSRQAQTDITTPAPSAEIMQIPASGSTSSTALGLIQAPTTGTTPFLASTTAGVMQTATSSFITTDIMQASAFGCTTPVMQAPTSVHTSTNVLLAMSISTPSTTTGSTPWPAPTSTTASGSTTTCIMQASASDSKQSIITGSTPCPTSTSTTTNVMQVPASASTTDIMQSPSSGSTTNTMLASASGSTAANVMQTLTSGNTETDILQSTASSSEPSTTAGLIPVVVTQAPSVNDTGRFMHIACLLVNVGSKVLRRLLLLHTVTPTCTLDQYLAKKIMDIANLRKRKILNKSQMAILFPPGGSTNLTDYDISLLSALFTNIVPNISQQQLNMIQFLREKRNEIFAHANLVAVNLNDYQIFWNDICRTLEALSKQCNAPDFENEISREIQGIQVSTVQSASLLDTHQTYPRRIETLERLVQYLISSHAQESNKESDDSDS